MPRGIPKSKAAKSVATKKKTTKKSPAKKRVVTKPAIAESPEVKGKAHDNIHYVTTFDIRENIKALAEVRENLGKVSYDPYNGPPPAVEMVNKALIRQVHLLEEVTKRAFPEIDLELKDLFATPKESTPPINPPTDEAPQNGKTVTQTTPLPPPLPPATQPPVA